MADSTSEQTTTSIDWGFLFQWVLANTLGWIAGWFLLGDFGVGVLVGAAQWVVLRQLVTKTGGWILLTTAGWLAGVALIVSGVLLAPGPDLITSMLAGAVIGAWVGLAQWFVLRQWVQLAGVWIFINLVAWATAFSGFFGSLMAGTVLGVFTGLVLDWLLRNARKEIGQY